MQFASCINHLTLRCSSPFSSSQNCSYLLSQLLSISLALFGSLSQSKPGKEPTAQDVKEREEFKKSGVQNCGSSAKSRAEVATGALLAAAEFLSLQDRTEMRDAVRSALLPEHVSKALCVVHSFEVRVIHSGLKGITKRPHTSTLVYYGVEVRLHQVIVSILETLSRGTSCDETAVRKPGVSKIVSLEASAALKPILFDEAFKVFLDDKGRWPVNLNRAYFAYLHPLIGANPLHRYTRSFSEKVWAAVIPSIKSMLEGDETSLSPSPSASSVVQFVSPALSLENAKVRRGDSDTSLCGVFPL